MKTFCGNFWPTTDLPHDLSTWKYLARIVTRHFRCVVLYIIPKSGQFWGQKLGKKPTFLGLKLQKKIYVLDSMGEEKNFAFKTLHWHPRNGF